MRVRITPGRRMCQKGEIMNKEEYMRQLKICLKRLPKEDWDQAVSYYEEYFADAGEENEARAIEDLGSPQEAADQIIQNLAFHYSEEPVKNIGGGIHAVWIALLALFGVPVGLPLLLSGVVVVVCMFVAAWLLLAAFLLCGACFVIAGPLTIIAGFTVLTKSIPVFLSCVGIGLLAIGGGSAFTYGIYHLCRRFLAWTLHRMAKMIRGSVK